MNPSRFRFRSRPDAEPSVDQLADAISTFGLAANEQHLEQFARRLMAGGQVPHLTAIMLDRSAAPIVRERAFARAAAALQNSPRTITHVA